MSCIDGWLTEALAQVAMFTLDCNYSVEHAMIYSIIIQFPYSQTPTMLMPICEVYIAPQRSVFHELLL